MDSLKKNESAPIEKPYLTREDWQSELFLPDLSVEKMLQNGLIYSPSLIISALERANYCLTHVPGPHLEERKLYADTWLGYWINEMGEIPDNGFEFTKSNNVKEFNALSGIMKHYNVGWNLANRGKVPAVWFVAGLEGHEGHRYALDQVLGNTHIIPMIVFEQEKYMKQKQREKFFLPLSLRVSMYSHYINKRGDNAFITMNPYKVVKPRYLNQIFYYLASKLNAIVTIPNLSDPSELFTAKVDRSLFLPREWGIHDLIAPSTSQRVRV